MARPPYSRLEKEAQTWFHKSYEECSDSEQIFCEDMAWEYCGMTPMEAEREAYYERRGKYLDEE